jgi:hypothetical protein
MRHVISKIIKAKLFVPYVISELYAFFFRQNLVGGCQYSQQSYREIQIKALSVLSRLIIHRY